MKHREYNIYYNSAPTTIWDECASNIVITLSKFKELVEWLAVPVSFEDLEKLLSCVSESLESVQQHMEDCAVKRKPDTSHIEMSLLKALMSATEELGTLELKLKLVKRRTKRIRQERYSSLHSYFNRLATALWVIHFTSRGPEDFFVKLYTMANLYAIEFANLFKQIINLDSYK